MSLEKLSINLPGDEMETLRAMAGNSGYTLTMTIRRALKLLDFTQGADEILIKRRGEPNVSVRML